MTQKQLILSVLEKLQPYRDMADGLVAFIESGHASDEVISSIAMFLQDKVKKVRQRMSMTKQQGFLSAIQEKEHTEKETELAEIEDLLAGIE